MERTVDYLAEKMGQFLRRGDPVLICFDADRPNALGTLFRDAALRCGARPQVWGHDRRWITLLRQAFDSRAGTVIAPPLVILGLTKLARAKGTPLYIRNVVSAGYPCLDWMIRGIRAGLDCNTWGCFDCGNVDPVAGFSCRSGWGVHLREDAYEALILDEAGQELPVGQRGRLVLRNRTDGALLDIHDLARVDPTPCAYGCTAPRLVDFGTGPDTDPELIRLGEELNRWTSVLDCRLEKGPSGLEIEIVVFPGEQLPKLPSCAKLIIRPWDPERDEPFPTDMEKFRKPTALP